MGLVRMLVDGVVDRQLPHDAAALCNRVTHGRQGYPLLAEPEMHLPDALELGEFGEDQRDSLAHPLVRVFGDPVVTNLHIADRHRQEQFAPPRFLLQCFQRTLPQD